MCVSQLKIHQYFSYHYENIIEKQTFILLLNAHLFGLISLMVSNRFLQTIKHLHNFNQK